MIIISSLHPCAHSATHTHTHTQLGECLEKPSRFYGVTKTIAGVPVSKSLPTLSGGHFASSYCEVVLFLSLLLQFEQLHLHFSKSHFSFFKCVVGEIDKEKCKLRECIWHLL